jgi:CO/xanthine dehydrogenase Mo-binding subunit
VDVSSAHVSSVRRKEDARLVRGRGSFVADRVETGTAAVAIVRSPHAHARIESIDVERAQSHDGIHAVLTSADLLGFLDSLPSVVESAPPYLPIAVDKVRFVGEPVAIVVARNRYLAEDAAPLVEIDYEALPVTVDPLEALEPGGASVRAVRTFWRAGTRRWREELSSRGRSGLPCSQRTDHVTEPRGDDARHREGTHRGERGSESSVSGDEHGVEHHRRHGPGDAQDRRPRARAW